MLAACSLLARSWSPPPSRPVTHISTAPCRSHEGNHFTLSPLLLDTRHTTGRLPRCCGRQGQERALRDGTGVAKDVLGRTGPCYFHDCRSQHHGIRNAQTSNRRQERAGRGDRAPAQGRPPTEPRRAWHPTQRHRALTPRVASGRGRGTACVVPERKPGRQRAKGPAAQGLVDEQQEGN